MAAGSVTTQLVKLLTATGATRLSYSNKKEPWCAGSRLRATSPGAAVVSGVNMYGWGDKTTARKGRVLIISTDANSDGATRKAYTIPADALALGPITLPVTASIATAAAYLDCMIGIAPNVNEIQNAVFGERIAYGGSLASAGQWKVDATDGFSFYTATTPGQVIVVFVPLAADIKAVTGTMVAGQEQEIASYDFLATATANVTLTLAPRLCG